MPCHDTGTVGEMKTLLLGEGVLGGGRFEKSFFGCG